jgi:hypothetical protein
VAGAAARAGINAETAGIDVFHDSVYFGYVKILVRIAFLLEQFKKEYTVTVLCFGNYLYNKCRFELTVCRFVLMAFRAFCRIKLLPFRDMPFCAYAVLYVHRSYTE